MLHLQQRPLTVSPLMPDHHKGVLTIFQKARSNPPPPPLFFVHGTTFGAPSVAPDTGRLALFLFVLCTNTSILLSLKYPPSPQKKESHLNSVKMGPYNCHKVCVYVHNTEHRE